MTYVSSVRITQAQPHNYACHRTNQFFAQLLNHPDYRQMIDKIARKNTRETAIDWEDAAQTAHIKLFQAVMAGKFRTGEINQFYRWSKKVARLAIIDLMRHEKQRRCTSLDQTIPGTNVSLLETIQDEFDVLDTVERTDLINRAIAAISELDQRYPNRGYQKLWQGKLQGKTQVELIADLGLKSQGAVSKRWRELLERLAEELGLLQTAAIQLQLKATSGQNVRRSRSTQAW
ncbi:MAG: sigma-70 family RNA polymerase sigma factor [Coleofasciculus sp. B1-GNL1-01]|uniref:sigma-70 family RNA polymerase sigma factor n=1 Tax=Coleofasciculus sp. B1-GNL1-01 TaxID=3068484 RepID=UPI0032FAE425